MENGSKKTNSTVPPRKVDNMSSLKNIHSKVSFWHFETDSLAL